METSKNLEKEGFPFYVPIEKAKCQFNQETFFKGSWISVIDQD